MLQTFSMVYRPEDVYINELFGSIAQLDAGVTTVMDVSQIHHSPEHSDAAIEGLRDAGRRSVFGYFEGWGDRAKYPQDARRIKEQYFSSDDQLMTMVMGGEIYLPGYEDGLESRPRAQHCRSRSTLSALSACSRPLTSWARPGCSASDNIFIHMTGMSEDGWKYAADAGAHVSLSVPIEMHMRHGTPPIQKAIDLGMEHFALHRRRVHHDRGLLHPDALAGDPAAHVCQREGSLGAGLPGADDNHGGDPSGNHGRRQGAQARPQGRLADAGQGSRHHPSRRRGNQCRPAQQRARRGRHAHGADNVDTVMVAGEVKKWKGQMLGFDIDRLRGELEVKPRLSVRSRRRRTQSVLGICAFARTHERYAINPDPPKAARSFPVVRPLFRIWGSFPAIRRTFSAFQSFPKALPRRRLAF
jgi:5-methylthioadenosine/S-adenosylhomocysteine deaminase